MNARDLTRDLAGHWHHTFGMVRCPVPSHGNGSGDPEPSLKISDREDGDGVTVHCFAGCPWQDVKDTLYNHLY